MSISSALSIALSGLNVAGRSADVTSANIANALTEGYGVRQLETSALVNGGAGAGVRVVGVTRNVDPILIGQRRGADADLGLNGEIAGFLTRVEALLGTPDDPASLSARVSAFEASLVSAANRPDSQARLTGVLDAASALAGKLNTLSDGVQAARLDADRGIAQATETLNDALARVHDLNIQIRTTQAGGRDIAALMDEQQALIDGISDLVPLRETRDSLGVVSLFSADGLALVDGRPSVFGFSAAQIMAPDMTLGNAALSGLTVNGRPVAMDGAFPALAGGRLAGLFSVRDGLGPEAQARLDAVARDLAERMDDPALDPTRAPGSPGLFTDAGSLANPVNETGLAGRLRVNALVDPARGGAVWRLRDGLGALSEGPVGNAALLQDTLEALQAGRPTASGGFSNSLRSFSVLAGDALSMTAIQRQSAEGAQSYAASRQSTLREAELRTGVDTDREMQQLLLIEQMFAANARMIQAAGDMIDQLMRI